MLGTNTLHGSHKVQEAAPMDRSDNSISSHLDRARSDLNDLEALAGRLHSLVDSMIGGEVRSGGSTGRDTPVPTAVESPLIALRSVRENMRDAMQRIDADLNRLSVLI